MIYELVVNIALLISLFSLYGLLERLNKYKKIDKILTGLLFGGIAIAGMVFRLNYENGIIYDGRSIILCLAGLFGGATVSVIAVIMAGIYRIIIGGLGVWAGLSTILITSVIGLIARQLYKNHPEKITLTNLYLLGIVAHIGMLYSQLVLPWPHSIAVISQIWLPVIIIYPIATLLIGFLLRNEAERIIVKHNLEASEQMYRDLVETSQDLIWQIDAEGKCTYLNPAWEEVFGYKNEEMIGKKFSDFQTEEWAERNTIQFNRILKHDTIKNLETVHSGKFGREINLVFKSKLVKDEEGNIIGSCGTAYDITENKKYESRLRLLFSAINTSSNAIVILNHKKEIEWANKGFTIQTGFEFQEAIGKTLRDLLGADKENDAFYENIDSKICNGESWTGEVENITKNGVLFYARTTITPFVDEVTGEQKFISIKEDITELKKTQIELIRANKIKDGFIANMSHEIRTPLNAIMGLTSLIKEMYGMQGSEDDNMIFDGVESASKRLIKTIEMVLNFSRLQAGELNVAKKEVDILEVCNFLIKGFNIFAKNKNLTFSLECNLEKTNIFADEYQITEAVSNLIDNAIKFTEEGFVKIKLYNNNNCGILLEISDSGIGISPEHLDFIFQPYMQEDMGYLRKFEGVGLGLSISKKYIELNDFTIDVNSEKNKGTTFTINFS